MANVSAVIDLRVNGTKQVDAIADRLNQINRIAKNIQPIPTLFDKRSPEILKAAKQSLTDLLKKYGEAGKVSGFGKSISSLNNQLSNFNRIASNADVKSRQFTTALTASENASRQLLRAELKRIQTLNNLYSTNAQAKGGGSVGIGRQLTELLKVGNTMPKSTAGLTTYRSELQRVLDLVDIGSKEYRELERAIRRVNVAMGDTGFSASEYGPQQAGGKSKKSKRSGRFGRIIQSAGIGGGFPLLFGGGPLQSIAGLLGGGIGEAISPRGGFAGSIAATAIVSQVSQAVTAVGALGKALNPLTADIGKLTQAIGIVGTAEAQRLKVIEQVAGKQAALKAASDLLANQIGTAGVQALKTFGKDFQTLGNEFSRLFTAMGASLANFINNSGALKALIDAVQNRNLRTQAFNNQDSKVQSAVSDVKQAEQALFQESINPTMLEGTMIPDLKERARLEKAVANARKAMIEAQKESNAETTIEITLARTAKDVFDANLENLKDESSILQEKITNGIEAADVKKLELSLQDQLNDKNFKFTQEQKDQLIDAKKFNDQLNRTFELSKQLKNVLVEGVTSAIEGLITGTKSLGDSLSSVLKQFGSILLRAGISNMMGGLNFGSFFGKGVATSAQGNYISNGIRPFATGGMATKPTIGLVGEAGEDEYIIPASKMSTAMQRYSSGARGQSVIPGTGSSQSGGGGGVSTTVNYSGPILTFNSEEFVPKAAVGAIIASATSQGAAMGETRTIRAMQNRRSIRTRVGI